MEILQEIGSYAGLAAILGLAVLSTLYFSQARDVKRLREWAGRAPERTVPTPVVQPKRIVAQPIPKPAQPVQPGGVKPVPPPVPRPPGAQPATPGAAAAAAAAPAVATGPAAVTPAAKAAAAAPGVADAETKQDEPSESAEEEQPAGEKPATEGAGGDVADTAEEASPTGEDAAAAASAEAGEADDGPSEGEEEAPSSGVVEPPAEPADEATGEWSPEDEHSDFELDEQTRPHVAPKVAPPTPPRPYRPPPRTPAARTASPRRADAEPLIPPYEQSRPKADSPSRSRRPLVLVAAVLVGLAVVAFGVMQLMGDDTEPATEIPVNVTSGSDADTTKPREAIDPSTVTVAVLNGTTVPGLAATIGDTIETEGFQIGTVTNDFDQQRAESVVRYAPGAEREAAEVARRLDIAQREAIDPDTQSLAGDASVVVVAGADQNR